jgi:hypothetical protein
MKAARSKKTEKKNTSFTTWKIQLENTVNADPMADGACLQVLRAYLDFMGEASARPYLSIIHLKVATSLHEAQSFERAESSLSSNTSNPMARPARVRSNTR